MQQSYRHGRCFETLELIYVLAHLLLITNHAGSRNTRKHIEEYRRIEVPTPQYKIPFGRKLRQHSLRLHIKIVGNDRIVFHNGHEFILINCRSPVNYVRKRAAQGTLRVIKIRGYQPLFDQPRFIEKSSLDRGKADYVANMWIALLEFA
jgi:hypothetical protein